MASDGREGRRRRIMERGSDRIALITGQIRTLDASSPPSSSSTYSHDQTTAESSQSITFAKNDHSLKSGIADDDSGSRLLKDKGDNLNQIETHSSSKATTTNPITASPVSNIVKNMQASSSSQPHSHHKMLCSRHINSCIIASEKARATCSLALALIVLVSYMDDSLIGINILSSENMIVSRPLYMLLLTDATIVVARMFVERPSNGWEEGVLQEKKEDPNNWTDAVKLLERGLVLYQAARGIFIDCSIYLAVVICGLSLI